MKTPQTAQSGLPLVLWLGYVTFVVYGSLVPLQFRARSVSEALKAFQKIPYLQLGIESRADWVANGVLYVPVGFLTVFLLTSIFRRLWTPFLHALAMVFCVVLAVSVEFTQLFFPPRTVSLNDLGAELLGSLLGITVAARLGTWFATLLASFLHDTRRLVVLGLDAYLVAYLAFALFPFDFLLSSGEIFHKSNSDLWGWILADKGQRASIQLLMFLAETALTLPFGFLLARLSRRISGGYLAASLFGLLLGMFVEFAQFFIVSGVSQGLSILSRVAGVCAGLWLYRYANQDSHKLSMADVAWRMRLWTPYLVLPYLLTLLEVNGWITRNWHGLEAATAQLARVNFMPFYYHYYTTEAIALFSLASVSMSYVPVGAMAWAVRRKGISAALLALGLAAAIEIGKLFVRGTHPDPTNLWIAATAAWATCRLLHLFSASRPSKAPIHHIEHPQSRRIFESRHTSSGGAPGLAAQTTPGPVRLVFVVLVLVFLGGCVVLFPALRLLVAAVVTIGCAAVWLQPRLVFAIIPATLPVLDLAPWSGRFFFDEFDILLLATVAVAYARGPTHPRQKGHQGEGILVVQPEPLFNVAVTLLALSFATSTMLGMWPWSLPGPNAFNNYFSHFNALRIAKGAVWALLIWRLSCRFQAAGVDVRKPFAWGMTAGVALTALWIVWERASFPGLLDFNTDYRVTGPFSVMHTGGAYADCYIAAAIPYLIVLTFERRNWLARLGGVALILVSTYALMTTYSRGGYLAYAVAVAATVIGVLYKSANKNHYVLAIAGLAAGIFLVALPVVRSDFLQSRLASVGKDFEFRRAHWSDAMTIRDTDVMTALFGMGLGRFPETKYWRSNLHPIVATYSLQSETSGGGANTFLRLAGGESIGVEQFVVLEPGQRYQLKMDVRPSHSGTKITVPICEKWLLTSARCLMPSFDLGQQKDTWRSIEMQVDAKALAPGPGLMNRPVKLSLGHSSAQSTLDIDNVRLLDANQKDLLVNGDFSKGLDNWFFSIAGTLHAHWRTHNLFVGILFDQGWLGLTAMITLLGVALFKNVQGLRRGDTMAVAALASICGYLVGGLLDTQIDAPRFLLLLLILIAFLPFAPLRLRKHSIRHS